MIAYMGQDLRCPCCGRPQKFVQLRSGDAWLTCWHQGCRASLWAVRVPASVPTPADVSEAVGDRIAASLLLTYAPGPVIVLEVPTARVAAMQTSSRFVLVARLTAALLGDSPMKAAMGPRLEAA